MTLLKTTRTRLGRGVERIRYPAESEAAKATVPTSWSSSQRGQMQQAQSAAIIASTWPFAQTGFSDGSQGHRMPAAAI